jgi:hypothetical protein
MPCVTSRAVIDGVAEGDGVGLGEAGSGVVELGDGVDEVAFFVAVNVPF